MWRNSKHGGPFTARRRKRGKFGQSDMRSRSGGGVALRPRGGSNILNGRCVISNPSPLQELFSTFAATFLGIFPHLQVSRGKPPRPTGARVQKLPKGEVMVVHTL